MSSTVPRVVCVKQGHSDNKRTRLKASLCELIFSPKGLSMQHTPRIKTSRAAALTPQSPCPCTCSASTRRRRWLWSEELREGLRGRLVPLCRGEVGAGYLAPSPCPWWRSRYHQSWGCQSPTPLCCSSGMRADIALTTLRAACWKVGSMLVGQLRTCRIIPRSVSMSRYQSGTTVLFCRRLLSTPPAACINTSEACASLFPEVRSRRASPTATKRAH